MLSEWLASLKWSVHAPNEVHIFVQSKNVLGKEEQSRSQAGAEEASASSVFFFAECWLELLFKIKRE